MKTRTLKTIIMSAILVIMVLGFSSCTKSNTYYRYNYSWSGSVSGNNIQPQKIIGAFYDAIYSVTGDKTSKLMDKEVISACDAVYQQLSTNYKNMIKATVTIYRETINEDGYAGNKTELKTYTFSIEN